jgi:hypothetical protein
LREEYGYRILENKALKKIFEPKSAEITKDWRKLHNEDLHNLYFSPTIIARLNPEVLDDET